MSGERIPDVQWAASDKQEGARVVLTRGKINLISSLLSRPSPLGRMRHEYSPSALFDELHATWFMEMLRGLIDAAIREFPGSSRVAIVLDNSPGYTGLEPSLEQWLTDIGPERGKFLFVSSMDSQDLLASTSAVRAIHREFCTKTRAARRHAMAMTGDAKAETSIRQDLALEEDEEDFFFRLAHEHVIQHSGDKRSAVSGHGPHANLGFYLALGHDDFQNPYDQDASLYLALLLNKLPEGVLVPRAEQLADLAALDHAQATQTSRVEDLKSEHDLRARGVQSVFDAAPAYAIPFKKEWTIQFLPESFLSQVHQTHHQESDRDRAHAHGNVMAILNQRGELLKNLISEFWALSTEPQPPVRKLITSKLHAVCLYDDTMMDVITRGERRHLPWLRELWGDEFSLVLQFRRVADIDGEVVMAREWAERYRDRATSIAISLAEEAQLMAYAVKLARMIRGLMRDSAAYQHVSRGKGTWLADNLEAVAGDVAISVAVCLGLKYAPINTPEETQLPPLHEEAHSLISTLLPMRVIADAGQYLPIPRGNSMFAVLHQRAKAWLEQLEDPEALQLGMNWMGKVGVEVSYTAVMETYREYCSAEAHFADLYADYRYLSACFNVLLQTEGISSSSTALLKDIARAIVGSKTESHENGYAYLKEHGEFLEAPSEDGAATKPTSDRMRISRAQELRSMGEFRHKMMLIMKGWQLV